MKPALPVLVLIAALSAGGAVAATKSSHARAPQAKAKTAKAKAARKHLPATRAAALAARPRIDYQGAAVNFHDWQAVREFADDMAARHGFARAELDALIGNVRFIDSAVQLVKPAPPGKPKNWQAYSARFVEPIRINAGVRFWNENAEVLSRAQAQYGVPAEVIVGILGVETLYGSDTGRFRVVDVLTTLAFAYPEAPNRNERMAFFRSELANALLFARQAGIDPFSLTGSFAGAVGMPQFMPGNILKFGVDFDGDGSIDLRNSAPDAIGSVANFLVQHGWNRDDQRPPVMTADVSPSRAWEAMLGGSLSARFQAAQLLAAGVATASTLAEQGLYGLVDLQNGADPTEYWVATDNFFAITNYNRSYFYAMSVLELGRAVKISRST